MNREIRLVIGALIIATVTVVACGHAAQAQTAEAPRVVSVDTSHYPEVSVTFDVAGGNPVAPWTATVEEGGQVRPASVQAGDAGGMEVVLAIDTSGSMAGAPMTAAKSAATAFVSHLPASTRVAVVGFGSAPYLVSPMTTDANALAGAIAAVQAKGETALYDALQLAADQFSTAPVPHSVILVSDGGDTVSAASLEAVTARLVERKVRLFAVRLATDETNGPVLDGLAAATSGRAADAADAGSLASTYQAVASSALEQVRLTFRSNGHGPTPVTVHWHDGSVEHTSAITLSLPAAQPAPPATVTTLAPAATTPVAPAGPNRTALVVGGLALFAGLLSLLHRVFARPPRSLLARDRRATKDAGLRDLKRRLGAAMEQRLERRGRRQALGARLEQAGIALRPGEYVVIVAATAALGGVCGLLLGGVALAVVAGIVVIAVARLLLSSRTSKRRAALEQQLPELLQQLCSSLHAGYGVMQAIDAVAREIDAPMSDELRRLVAEVQLGRDLTESMGAMAARVGGQDFDWVVQAVEINREVGGDLVEVLEAVADTIRARESLRRQIKTLSAQGRLSARILIAMPFVMAVLISAMNPGYLSPFVERSAGPVLIVVGMVLMGTGWLWLRRIVRIEL